MDQLKKKTLEYVSGSDVRRTLIEVCNLSEDRGLELWNEMMELDEIGDWSQVEDGQRFLIPARLFLDMFEACRHNFDVSEDNYWALDEILGMPHVRDRPGVYDVLIDLSS